MGARSFAVAMLAAGALAACSGGGPSSTTLVPARTATLWKLQAGIADKTQADQGLNYYPTTITIDAGDTIVWTFPAGEPHTVTLLGAGQTAPPPPNDPNVSAPAGGNSYDGSTYVSSGFQLLGGSYGLTFTKPGSYKVYCLIHQPEMEMTINVKPAGAPYPQTQAQLDAAGATQSQGDLAAALQSIMTFPYAGQAAHLAAGISPGTPAGPPANTSVVRFLSDTDTTTGAATVAVGTTVTWTNLSNNLPHTVTFGVAGQPFPTLDPFAPPSGPTSYDGSALTNSGPLFPGQSYSLTFTKAGTYTYHCIFHDDTENMISTITVQ